jgi:aldehyde dehydrogenase (NAD+)
MQTRKFYIDGRWVEPIGDGSIDVIDPSTEDVIGTVPEGTVADAGHAVDAARAAFEAWSQTTPSFRSEFLDRIADGLQARRDELARLIAGEVGMPLKLAGRIQVDNAIQHWRHSAALARSLAWEERVDHSLVVREPVGVVAAITPWNFPLNQITLKVAAALAAGCTVVLKPSEVAPLNAFALAQVMEGCGLPAGVFNLITGFGPVVGEALARHPEVDMVSFTGSTRPGKRVMELAAHGVKRVALELGGKSAAIVLDDADFPAAVKATVSNCFLNSGQTCSAQTRLLVPEGRYDEARQLAKSAAEGFVLGPALSEGARLGPLVSAVQRDRVRGHIRQALESGAELVTGGPDAPAALAQGYFVQPTVFGRVDPKSALAQEEVFGPVLAILTYRDEDEAVRLANDSIYGLAGAVWSGDAVRAQRVARRIRSGQVDVNGGPYNPLAPFGGYKQSGIGRENGRYGIEEYLQYKTLNLKAVS